MALSEFLNLHYYSDVAAEDPRQRALEVGGSTAGAVAVAVFYRWESCYSGLGIGRFGELLVFLSFADCCQNWGFVPSLHSSTPGQERQDFPAHPWHHRGAEMGYHQLGSQGQSLRRSQKLGRGEQKAGRGAWKAWQDERGPGLMTYFAVKMNIGETCMQKCISRSEPFPPDV